MLEWEWYDDTNTKILFLHLLLTVNYENKKWHGIIIECGQRLVSYSVLSDELGLSIQSIRTSINKLKSTGELTIKSTNKYTLITLTNWGIYQSLDNLLTSKLTSKLTNDQQTTNKRLTTTKEYKNIKNNKKEILSACADEGFFEKFSANEICEKCYSFYPRKDGKSKGIKLFLNYLKQQKYNHFEILIAIQEYSYDMENKDNKYIQMFSSFMGDTINDYISKTIPQYESVMLEKYGENWRDIKFIYTGDE